MVPTLIWSGKWEHVAVRWSPTRPDLYGRSVRDLATERNVHPVDVLLDIAVARRLRDAVRAEHGERRRRPSRAMVAHPAAMIGASDAGAHVLSNTDSCYAVWTLQHWVRERERAHARARGPQAHRRSGRPARLRRSRSRAPRLRGRPRALRPRHRGHHGRALRRRPARRRPAARHRRHRDRGVGRERDRRHPRRRVRPARAPAASSRVTAEPHR